MQKTISFTYKGKKYVSKPFDFKALCLVSEMHTAVITDEDGEPHPKHSSIYVMCAEAVDYMFEGTEADAKVLDAVAPGTRARLCREIWAIYINELSGKNAEAAEA